MSQKDLEVLVEKMGAVAVYLQQCAQEVSSSVSENQQQLDQAAQGFDDKTSQLSSAAVHEISQQTMQAVAQGLNEANNEYNARLKNAGESANQAIYHLNQSVQALERGQKSLIWKAGLALVVGAVLAVIGLGTYGWRQAKQIQANNYTAAIAKAVQNGQIASCGENLCAKVGKNPRKAGANAEYMVIQP